MGDLILIRHAEPVVEESQPPREWALSDSGRLRCRRVAARLVRYDVSRLVGSTERKATQTARLLGTHLGLPVVIQEGLQENDRTGVPFYAGEAEFKRSIRDFFAEPGARVMGAESADEAHRRFLRALEEHGPVPGAVAIVSHGAVISLCIARANGLDPYQVWTDLGFGSIAVLTRPGFALREIVHDSTD